MVSKTLTINYNVNITNISGSVTNSLGVPIEYARVFFFEKWGPSRMIETDINGKFSFDAREGEEGSLVIVELMYDRKITVPPMDPGATTIDFRNIIPDVRFGFPLISFNP